MGDGDSGLSRIARLAGIALGLLVLLLLGPTAVTYVNPGHVGIVIHRTGGGVDPRPLGPGLHARNPLTTGIEEYPTFMQTLVLTRASSEGSSNNDEINVNSVEGQPLSLDVSMSFELDPTKVPALYSTFRTDIGTIQHTYVKQAIRQALQEVVATRRSRRSSAPRRPK
jgi:regulator of protease activity HflC (stomatin/prohibitin superfamily)